MKDECKFSIYQLSTLIDDLPIYEYTAIDLFDNHIFLGTATGELLHYFEIQPSNYLLVSNTKYLEEEEEQGKEQENESSSNTPIIKIKVMPLIERAWVLNGNGQLKLYILPEFAPVPNTEVLKNVNDISIYKNTFHMYKTLILAKNSVSEESYYKLIECVVDKRSMRLTDFEIRLGHASNNNTNPMIKNFILQKNTLLTVTKNNYVILELSLGKENNKIIKKMPLFKVFEGNTDNGKDTDDVCSNKHILTSFSSSEFLVACGSTLEDSAMALIIDNQGNITKGTIVLESGYPNEMLVDDSQSFVIANYQSEKNLEIYDMNIGWGQPKLVQTISFDKETARDNKVKLFKSSHQTFNDTDSKNNNNKKLATERLRLVPINLSSNNTVNKIRIDQEKIYIEQNYENVSNILVYGKGKIDVLYKTPMVLEYNDYDEELLYKLENILASKYAKTTKFYKIQLGYLQTLYLLLLLLHKEKIDLEVQKEWIAYSGKVDLRIFFYILGFKIYGDLWVYNGLTDIIEKLKILKLIHKIPDVITLFGNFASNTLSCEFSKDIKDVSNVIKTVSIAYLKVYLGNSGSPAYSPEMVLDNLNLEISSQEIIDFLENYSDENESKNIIITSVFLRTKQYGKYLAFLKNINDSESIFSFLSQNWELFSDLDLKIDYLIFAIEHTKMNDNGDNPLLKATVNLIETQNLSLKDVIRKINNNEIKVSLIESQISKNIQETDRQFLMNYYIERLSTLLFASSDKSCMLFIQKYQESYLNNPEFEKPNFSKYMLSRLEITDNEDDIVKNFLKLHEKLCKLMDQDKEILYPILINKFQDLTPILFLFITDNDDRVKYLKDKSLILNTLLSLNDFETINRYWINKETILVILDHYLKLSSSLSWTRSVTQKFIEKNIARFKDLTLIYEILLKIPENYQMNTIASILYYSFSQLNFQLEHSELQKRLVKKQLIDKKELNKKLRK
ncbi:uncharacterized protein SCODWIG_03195 [Saccharomycodes ludwigii]|uniref:CNH domain-containing protein n=1 Tax=Saccharomycodes ludwigii TaxID=36035 RepID=A0A376BA64_9ASCO|nr:uncharacterized protein SCODWIG_03195 [Saccharomycodes ludwigii]